MNEDKCKSLPLIIENVGKAAICLLSYSRVLAPTLSRIKSGSGSEPSPPSKNLQNRFPLGIQPTTQPESTFRYACPTQLFISSTIFFLKMHRWNSNYQKVQNPSSLLRLHFTERSAAFLGARCIKNVVKTCVELQMLRIELNVISHNIEQYQFKLKARLKDRKRHSTAICWVPPSFLGRGQDCGMRIWLNGSIWPRFKRGARCCQTMLIQGKADLDNNRYFELFGCPLLIPSSYHPYFLIKLRNIGNSGQKTVAVMSGSRDFEESKPNSSKKPPYFASIVLQEGRAKYTTSYAKCPINQPKTHISTHNHICSTDSDLLMHLPMFPKFPCIIMGHSNNPKDALELITPKHCQSSYLFPQNMPMIGAGKASDSPNKFMFITSQPYHQKRNFKFSNRLAGKVYNNNRFLSSCSYLESDIKLSTAGSEDESFRPNYSQFRINDDVSLKATVMRKDSREMEIRSVADKFSKRVNQTSAGPAFRRNSAATDRRPQKGLSKTIAPEPQTRRTSLFETALTMVKQVIVNKKSNRKRNLKRKMAFNPDVDTFYSPFVEIRIIDRLKDLKEIQQRSIKVDFQRIYKKLIKTQLMGQFTANFMETVQRYIREIVESNQMWQNQYDQELDSSLRNISRKEEFLDKLIDLWGMNETNKIQALVKYYCIPSEATSQTLLKELIQDLVIDIYQKKSCNRDIDYVLLTQTGQQIVHISQIYFSTHQLLLTPKQTSEKNYLHYRYLIDEHDRSLKMNMKQSIKHDFVEKIVFREIDQLRVNYQHDPHQYNQYRREIVEQATAQIQSKSKLRLQPKKLRDTPSELRYQQYLQRKSSSRNHNLFTNYILRKQKQKKQYAEILQRLRIILDPNHKYTIRSKLDQSTEQQFRKLHLYNDHYDITYNHNKSNSQKMFLINMIENCEIFNKKNTEQLEKILSMLENAYGMGDLNLNQIQYWQFKEIYQTAHGVAHKDVIMKFVLSYFNFDQYGQMKREDFFQALDVCLTQTGRPKRMIKDIIWNLLQKMGLIVNKNLNRRNLSIWYQPIKVIYMLLLSIIFGGEYESIQEMINDLITFYD